MVARSKDDTAKQLREFIRKAQDELEDLQDKGKDVLEDVHDRKESVEDFIKENPLLAIGGAFVAGWFIGRLLKRSRRRR